MQPQESQDPLIIHPKETSTKEPSPISRLRWISIASTCCAMLASGSVYCFSLYGPQIKDRLDLSQFQLSIISSSANNGLYLASPIVGSLVDKIQHPKAFLFVGSFCFLVGYTCMGILYSWNMSSLYGLMAFFNFVVGVGASSSFHSAMATNYRNFPPNERGRAVGIPVAFFGLSAFLYTLTSHSFFFENDSLNVLQLLIFMGVSCCILTLTSGVFLVPISLSSADDLLPTNKDDGDDELDHLDIVHATQSDEQSYEQLDTNTSFSHEAVPRTLEHDEQDSILFQSDSNHTPSILRNLDAYLVGISLLCVVGVGLMYINNVGSIVVSLITDSKEAQKNQGFQVALLSVSNFMGRLGSGVASDYLFKRFRLNRLFWSFLAGVFVFFGSFLATILVASSNLWGVTVLIGIGYGMIWTGTPVLVGEYFGVAKFATHWGFYQPLAALGGQLTSFVFGSVYDSGKQGQESCLGNSCFQFSFYFAMGLCAVSMMSVVWLYINRSRKFKI